MEKNNSNDKKPGRSQATTIAICVVSSLIIFLLGFSLGAKVGFHKARFSNDFGRNYEKNFMGPHSGRDPIGMFDDFEVREMRNPHGMAGEILSIEENRIIIKDRDEKENSVSIDENTVIKKQRETLKISDLKSGDKIAVLGKPDEEGKVVADLIRVFDPNNNPFIK